MIRFNYFLLAGVFELFSVPAFSQGIKLSYVPKTVTHIENNSIPYFNYKIFYTPTLHANPPIPLQNGIHYTAFFCRMESKVHDKLNIWVKLRAGSDEEYRKLYEPVNH